MPELSQNEVECHASVPPDSDAMLLFLVAQKDEDRNLAGKAMEEFVRRYRSYVFKRSYRIVNGDAGATVGWTADSLATAVFARVWEKADTFKDAPDLPPNQRAYRLKGWLGRITNNLFIDQLRKCRNHFCEGQNIENMAGADSAARPSVPEAEQEMLREAMSTLTEREHQVIIVTGQYFRFGVKQQRLPNHVSRELAETLGTTSTNVRQIRKRAKMKLREFMRSKGFNNSTYTRGEDGE